MKKYSFRGGIHPHDSKEQTRDIPITILPPAEVMVFPMQQHLGAPCQPIVKKGDRVKMWQKIGDSDAFMSSPVHSSISGEVIAIEPRLTPNGSMVTSVVIKNDFKDEICEDICPASENASIKEVVREAGIVGMGGAGFPTHIKLSPPEGKKVKYIIVNGAECEPYLTSDHRVMIETPAEVVSGLLKIMSAVNAENAIIAIEENKPEAINNIKNAATGTGIKVKVLKTKYPQGSEKQLINAITGKQVPSGGLPIDIGVIVVNIDTCTAIARAYEKGIPLVRRIVTVSGTIIKEPRNFSVRLGMPIRDVIEAAGGFTEQPAKILMGGPMMGLSISSLDIPVVKGTGAILAFDQKTVLAPEPTNCIRCGRCVSGCPIHLKPLTISAYSDMGDFEKCKKSGAMDCIECGSCTYSCPARRHLVQSIRLAKQKIRAMNVKK